MADEHSAAEPPPGSPGQRALGAMENAVKRARESAGVARPPDPTPTRGTVPTQPEDRTEPVAVVLPGEPVGRPPSPGRERWLTRTVALVAALVGVAAIALVVSLIASPTPSNPTATRPAPTTAASTGSHSTNPRLGGRGRTAVSTPSSSSTTSTSTTVAVAPNGPPVISSLSPSSGSAGQIITISGANFLSTDGHIVATFNGQVAPTSCPGQNACTVTVPPSTSPSAQVVVTTAGGVSNAETFNYG